MRFRTEIEPLPRRNLITASTHLTLLGSCFADNIGQRLERDGFDCLHNPLGPLFNPLSIANCLEAALSGRLYRCNDCTPGPRGFHCLDFASRYSGADGEIVAAAVNADLERLRRHLHAPGDHVVVLTLGSAYSYRLDGVRPVGNCHKFPPARMERVRLDVEECVAAIYQSLRLLPENVKVLLTVSPVRHLDEGLHGNNLNKAVLQLAVDKLVEAGYADYFPAYEMLVDDLRDYRFYAADLKHPSEPACDYIYEHFCRAMMNDATLKYADEQRRKALLQAHRPLLEN